jgi:23S rRNA maturation-related 3'-5' exoribonuclease YhaM
MNSYIKKLTGQAKTLGDDVYKVSKGILKDKRFPLWSGSSKPHQHHYGKGGLVKHTSEVVDLCFRVKSFYDHTYEIDSKELFLSAFFHDVGKMHDYKPAIWALSDNGELDYSTWESTSHKRLIHHISRSGIMWAENAKLNDDIYEKYFDKVLHAILAHHTCREAGSPVAPKSRVAWMVTLCDNLSARINDADTWDILNGR